MESNVLQILEQASDPTLAKHIVESYKEVERHYFLKQWKTSELDAGHFVETVRRFIDFKLSGKYLAIGKQLPSLNEAAIKFYIDQSGDDSYRIHIPRVLLSVYGIRNKRGVGHISHIRPNHLDATFVIASIKWVLAELIRINSNISADETSKIVDHIIDRDFEGVWEQEDITRILAEGLSLKEQILFLLLATNLKTDLELLAAIEAKNKTYFKKLLRELHTSRLIEYQDDGSCILSPKGSVIAEKIVLEKINV